ncbi:MAG: HlyC/CorC family transporter [Planctomycetes bacterium]|nr:HlyC/CorC family transporter [Planctomycetota bacterium]
MDTIYGVALFLAFLFALVRRCFRTTSTGEYHGLLEQDTEKPESEQIYRIELMLWVFQLLSQCVWASVLFSLRSEGVAWYGSWLNPEVFAAWWWAFWILEILLLGLLILELLPEAISIWIGPKITVRLVPILSLLEKLFSPLTVAFRRLRRSTLKALGGNANRSEKDLAEADIMAAVEMGERQGLLEQGEKTMIESLLHFREADVEEVMTPRTDMVCFEAAESVEEVIPKAVACGHSRIPVYRKKVDDIIGVLYVKDLLRHAADDGMQSLHIEKLVRKSHFVPENKNLHELLAEFRADRFHIAVVLDEYGGTTGLVTIEDILEEIVGEIEDEYDTAGRDQIRKAGENTYDIDGRTSIQDINRALSIELPESDDYETVAGFLFSEIGHVPKEGEEFTTTEVDFKVIRADERTIKRIRATLQETSRNGS